MSFRCVYSYFVWIFTWKYISSLRWRNLAHDILNVMIELRQMLLRTSREPPSIPQYTGTKRVQVQGLVVRGPQQPPSHKGILFLMSRLNQETPKRKDNGYCLGT